MLLIFLLVQLAGGFLKLKRKCLNVNINFLRKLLLFIYKAYNNYNSSGIAYNCCFKGEPCFPHGIKGVFISGDAVLGTDCVIYQQVTIGSVTFPDSSGFGSPVIGDKCYIGSGAKVLGKIKIGNNVRIGANSTVYFNVPDNSIVLPGSAIIKSGLTHIDNTYYTKGKNSWLYFVNGNYETVKDDAILRKLNKKNNQ